MASRNVTKKVLGGVLAGILIVSVFYLPEPQGYVSIILGILVLYYSLK